MIEKTRKVQENHIHDFIFDDGHLKILRLLIRTIFIIIFASG